MNEENNILRCIDSAKRINPYEIIVVDGGSIDRTTEIAKNNGAIVIKSPRGRGIQMNRGAFIAEGDILLFLHADAVLSLEPNEQGLDTCYKNDKIMNGLSEQYIGGYFRLKFDYESLPIKLVELFANLRARLFSLPYGDQAIFVRKDIFKKTGGFKEYPFLEDLDLVIRLKNFGKLRYIPCNVIVSSRRIKKGYPLSPILVSLRNVAIVLFFMLGISPYRLLKLYK